MGGVISASRGVQSAGVCIIDRDGYCTFINSAGARLLGRDSSELIGRPAHSLFQLSRNPAGSAPTSGDAVVEPVVGEAGETSGQGLLRLCDGSTVPIAYQRTPVVRGGQVEHVILTFAPQPAAPEATTTEANGGSAPVNLRRNTEERLRILAETSGLLTSSFDYQQTLANLARLAVPAFADFCVVNILEGPDSIARVGVAHVNPAKERIARELETRYPLTPSRTGGVAQVMRTGQTLFEPRTSDATYAGMRRHDEQIALLRAIDLRSVIIVPIMTRGQTFGTITFAITESDDRYEPTDVTLAEDIARRAALAIDTARLVDEVREAARQKDELLARAEGARAEAERAAQMIERVQSITDAALEHLDLDALLEELMLRIREALNVDTATILMVNDDNETLSALTSFGLEESVRRQIRVPIGKGFAGRIVARRAPLIVEDVDSFPVVNPVLREHGVRSLMGAPLLLDERVVGVVHVGSLTPRSFRPSELHLLQLVAGRIALAINRANLYESERNARAAAETAQRRLSFLARASAILATSLDYDETLTSVARLALPQLADICTVTVIDPDGTMHRIVAATTSEIEATMREEQRFSISLDAPFGIARVFRTGQSELFPSVDQDWFRQIARNEEHLRIMQSLDVRSGMMVPLNARARAIGVLSFWSIDPERKYSQDDLDLAEELGRRCALAVDNAQLYREANRAIRLRDEFLSVASHELKTPMTTVKGYVQLLDRQIHTPSTGQARVDRTMAHLRAQVERFEELVSELLDVSRLQSGRLELHLAECDLREIAREVVNRFQHAAERTARHRLVLDAPQPVEGRWDASRLDQVLTNLVSNALKYSPEGGEVRVSIRADDATAEFVVSDQGIGIPEAEQAVLFQPFTRGATATGTAAGSGLGLHISAQIVERHGGTIAVESEPGVGSRFTVRLPRGVQETRESQS